MTWKKNNASTAVGVTRGGRWPSERWVSGETSRSQEDLEEEQVPSERWGLGETSRSLEDLEEEQVPSERWGLGDLKQDLKGWTVPLHNVLFLYISVSRQMHLRCSAGILEADVLHCPP